MYDEYCWQVTGYVTNQLSYLKATPPLTPQPPHPRGDIGGCVLANAFVIIFFRAWKRRNDWIGLYLRFCDYDLSNIILLWKIYFLVFYWKSEF